MTAVLTDHGMTKAYLHRFHLGEESACRCPNEIQSMDHILFHCVITREKRETMIRHIGTWPISKQDLIKKRQKIFSAFVESIDFEETQSD